METINHEYYVSLEVAKLLKEAGFDWEVNHSYPDVSALDNLCSGYMEDLPFYHNLNDGKYGGLSAPSLDVAQRWLRETQKYHVEVSCDGEKGYLPIFFLYKTNITQNFVFYSTYEEALEAGIQKALKYILKDKEDGRNTNN